jgi:hypothetical protein
VCLRCIWLDLMNVNSDLSDQCFFSSSRWLLLSLVGLWALGHLQRAMQTDVERLFARLKNASAPHSSRATHIGSCIRKRVPNMQHVCFSARSVATALVAYGHAR